MMRRVKIPMMYIFTGEKRMDVMIDKEELEKWLKGLSTLSLALAMAGEDGIEVSPEADYVISRILDAIATMAA